VTIEFSRTLRRLAATDNLINTAGVTGYAQAVLVPELSVLLVKEDMGVDDQGPDGSSEKALRLVKS